MQSQGQMPNKAEPCTKVSKMYSSTEGLAVFCLSPTEITFLCEDTTKFILSVALYQYQILLYSSFSYTLVPVLSR